MYNRATKKRLFMLNSLGFKPQAIEKLETHHFFQKAT